MYWNVLSDSVVKIGRMYPEVYWEQFSEIFQIPLHLLKSTFRVFDVKFWQINFSEEDFVAVTKIYSSGPIYSFH